MFALVGETAGLHHHDLIRETCREAEILLDQQKTRTLASDFLEHVEQALHHDRSETLGWLVK